MMSATPIALLPSPWLPWSQRGDSRIQRPRRRAFRTKTLCRQEPSELQRDHPRSQTGFRSAMQGGAAASSLAISIQNLALTVKSDRGNVPVLKECSLSVPKGRFWMLLGPNGCGKSTLLKAMAGLLRPSGGHMYVVKPRSVVFQNPDHQVVMPTAEADVAFGLGRFDLPDEEVCRRVQESLDAVGMAEYAQRSVQTLSGGQKQRIAIAGALAESSRLLLLDELTTYLDSGDQIGVLEAVRKVVGGPHAVTALWVTHRLEELEYADGAAYMESGKVVLNGSVAEIRRHIRGQQEEFGKDGRVLANGKLVRSEQDNNNWKAKEGEITIKFKTCGPTRSKAPFDA